jgi:purine-binding chemotaxis protein CheW
MAAVDTTPSTRPGLRRRFGPTVEAIAADRVRSVVEIAAGVIDPVPSVPGSWNSGAMKGVTRLDGALVYLIDLREALRMAPKDVSGLKGPFDFD